MLPLPILCFAHSATVDSLCNVLPLLKGSNRIDCLNRLSQAYILAENKDSAHYFASIGYKEAMALGYIHGIAVSLIRKARIAKHFDDDFRQSETLARESLDWYKKTSDQEGLYDVYYELAYALHSQSRFTEAIEFTQKRYDWSEKAGDSVKMFDVLQAFSAIYKDAGNYEKSFYYCQQARQFAIKYENNFLLQTALISLGELYMRIEDYQAALANYRQAFAMDTPEFEKIRKEQDFDIWMKMEYAEIFSHLLQFDSAWKYFQLYKPATAADRYYRIYLVSTGEFYFLQRNYTNALENFISGLYYHKKLNDRNEIQRTLIFIAKTCLALGNDSGAMRYAKEGLQLANDANAKQIIRDCYQILSAVFEKWHKTDSANFYFRRYITMKEAVLNDQTKGKLAAYNYEQKIALIEKQKEIQQAKLEKESFVKKILIAGMFILFLFGFIIVRNVLLKRRNDKLQMKHAMDLQKLESERAEAGLQQRATLLEMQALRSQMNPHFIFNSLNSINRFILQNNKAQASEYLTKFSKLVRLILQNSQAALIPLESELEALQLYLELEAVRFDHHFDYAIEVKDELDTDMIKVPPLLIQPYAENAVWHGLMHKEEKGHLGITLFQEQDVLCCRITDDGIGRTKAKELKSRSASTHRSMGMRITADRIAMLQQRQHNAAIQITDLILDDGTAGGTEILLKIPMLYA